MSFWKRVASTATAATASGPKPMPSPAGVPIYGENEPLARVMAARDYAIPMLEAATTQEERFKALLIFTNMSKKALDRITALLEEIHSLSAYDPGRQTALDWATAAVDTIKDTNRYSAEQQTIARALGDQRSQAVLSEVQNIIDELLADPTYGLSSGTEEITEPDLSLAVFGHDDELRHLIRERNDANGILEIADTDEQRLVALYVFTRASGKIVARISSAMNQIAALPEYSAERDQALGWLKKAHAVVERWPEKIALREELSATLGPRATEMASTVADRRLTGSSRFDDDDVSAAGSTSAAEKVCPDCAETIKSAARVCRFCGYRFDEQPS